MTLETETMRTRNEKKWKQIQSLIRTISIMIRWFDIGTTVANKNTKDEESE